MKITGIEAEDFERIERAFSYILGKQLLHPMRKVTCVETGEVFDSIAMAARNKGLCAQNIWHVCQGHFSKSGGYRWRYTDGS